MKLTIKMKTTRTKSGLYITEKTNQTPLPIDTKKFNIFALFIKFMQGL